MKLGSYKPLPGHRTPVTLPDPKPIMHYKVFQSPEEAMFAVNRKYLGTAGTYSSKSSNVEEQVETEVAQLAPDVNADIPDTVEKRGRKRK